MIIAIVRHCSLWTNPKPLNMICLLFNWYFEYKSYSKLTNPKSVVCCEKRSYSKKLWVGILCCSLCKENYFWPRACGPRNIKLVIYLKILLDKMKNEKYLHKYLIHIFTTSRSSFWIFTISKLKSLKCIGSKIFLCLWRSRYQSIIVFRHWRIVQF